LSGQKVHSYGEHNKEKQQTDLIVLQLAVDRQVQTMFHLICSHPAVSLDGGNQPSRCPAVVRREI